MRRKDWKVNKCIWDFHKNTSAPMGVGLFTPNHAHVFNYPRATRCGGHIVTLPWFRQCVRPSVSPSVCHALSLWSLLAIVRGWTPIEFGGQRSKVKVTIDIYRIKLVNTIETKPLCASSSNLADVLAIVRRRTLLILEVKGQCHNKQKLKW